MSTKIQTPEHNLSFTFPLLKKGGSCIFFILYTFLFLQTLTGYAQLTYVYGTVVDSKTKEPLPFISLTFKNSNIGTSTGISGSYRLRSDKPVDSLIVSGIGYKKQVLFVERHAAQRLNIELQQNEHTLQEVLIKQGRNPALRILDSVLVHKEQNGISILMQYEWEQYDKFQMYFGKYADQIKELKPFREYSYIFRNTDSLNEQALLPIYMSETIQKRFVNDSLSLREDLLIARKSTGENYENLTTMTDRLLENKNIYSDYYQILDKSFVSPLINNYQLFYNYERDEDVIIGKKLFYKIDFEPKWKEDFTFYGTVIIDPQTWAVKRIHLKVSPDINLNYVKSLSITQDFQQVEKKWIMHKLETWVTLSALKWQKGEDITVHRYTSYKDVKLSGDIKLHYLQALENATQNDKTEAFWKASRHVPLGKKEKYNYTIADTINQVPFVRRAKRVATILISGYMELGKISLYQANTFYSKNPIEVNRFKFGLITNKYFSTTFQLSGYAAYGTRDKEFKYKMGLLYVLNKNDDRAIIGASYRYDLEQLGVSPNHIAFDNVLTLFSKINQKVKLTFGREASLYVEKEWVRKGIISRLTFVNKEIRPIGSIRFEKRVSEKNNQIENVKDLTSSDIRLNARFSYRERFYVNEFRRISLGSRYPILIIDFIAGLKDVLRSDYTYQKLKTNLQGKFHINPVGYIYYNLEGGKIFGTVPFPLATLHPANQSLAYDVDGFNVMNYFEFASDRYISLYLDHHWDGFFLNKIPYVQKAKLREVISARGVIGDLHSKNRKEMILPEGMSSPSKPYIEYSVGIENIFKVLRIDYIWRGTHLEVAREDTWAVKARFFLAF